MTFIVTPLSTNENVYTDGKVLNIDVLQLTALTSGSTAELILASKSNRYTKLLGIQAYNTTGAGVISIGDGTKDYFYMPLAVDEEKMRMFYPLYVPIGLEADLYITKTPGSMDLQVIVWAIRDYRE